MLPPEPNVLLSRQCFADAQLAMIGAKTTLGFYTVGWYAAVVDDDRGNFAVVSSTGPLVAYVGDFLNLKHGKRDVYAYVIGSVNDLDTDLAVTRRTYMAIELLAREPARVKVSLAS